MEGEVGAHIGIVGFLIVPLAGELPPAGDRALAKRTGAALEVNVSAAVCRVANPQRRLFFEDKLAYDPLEIAAAGDRQFLCTLCRC